MKFLEIIIQVRINKTIEKAANNKTIDLSLFISSVYLSKQSIPGYACKIKVAQFNATKDNQSWECFVKFA